jgi:lactoylglutathione lyase
MTEQVARPEPASATTPAGKFAAVGIGVSDMERSVEFYVKVLGMSQLQVFDLPHMKEVIVGYGGDIAVALMHYTDGSAQNYTDNPVKLVFNVDDPAAIFAKVRAAGLEIMREPEPVPEFGNMIVGLAKDPDGYVVEVLKLPQA